ncbi:MAG TPA: PAS domain S-box protein [Bryobacteraceae bacterium]|nr:PAS domain S-box protein [Bryobacteraceae bacterium]
MTGSAKSKNDIPPATSIPEGAASLESILCTEELLQRTSRPPDHAKENAALVALASALAESGQSILDILAGAILQVTDSDSAGLSLLTSGFATPGDERRRFYSATIKGMWKGHAGDGTQRNFDPCGDVLDRNCTLLLRHFERRYPDLLPVSLAAEECLLVPFYVRGNAVGSIWAMMHTDRRRFDSEDERLMRVLGQFASLAYQTLGTIDNLKSQINAREKAEARLRELTRAEVGVILDSLQAQVRTGEEFHRVVVETASDTVVSIDHRGDILLANHATTATFGYEPAELIGQPLTILMPEYLRDLHRAGLKRYQETGHRHINWQSTELIGLRKNGEEFPVEVSFGEFNSDGRRVFTGFIRDISERKQVEEALRASERGLGLIVETIPGLVWCAAPDGELNYLNQRILDYTGTRAGDWAQLGWKNLLHPEDAETTAHAWSRAVTTGQPLEVQCRLRRSDGAYRWFQALGQAARDSAGGVTRWYGLLIDIDDRKNMEEALRNNRARLSRAIQTATIGEFAAAIAHEVNQPLAAVVTNAQACLRWLAAEPPGMAKAHEAAERIVRDGKEAGEIVRRIRALFRQAAVDNVEFDMNEVIGEVLHLLTGETTRRRVAVETDLGLDLSPVLGDRVQLQQVVFNLLLNGIEAMDRVVDRPKQLFICSKQPNPETILVEVRDCGPGIKDPDRIFEAFFTTKENGMGMGLAICRSIIDAHRGRLWAASGEGSGATFSFTLPVRVAS